MDLEMGVSLIMAKQQSIGQLTFIVSELAGDADNTQFLGGYPSIFAKKPELVANLDNQDGVHMFALNVEKLDLHWGELSGLGALFLPLRCGWRLLFLRVFASISILGIRSGIGVRLKVSSSDHGHAVWMAKFLDELFVQLLLFPRDYSVVVVGRAMA